MTLQQFFTPRGYGCNKMNIQGQIQGFWYLSFQNGFSRHFSITGITYLVAMNTGNIINKNYKFSYLLLMFTCLRF